MPSTYGCAVSNRSGQGLLMPAKKPPTANCWPSARNRSSSPRWSITSTLRTCRPSARTYTAGSASFSSTSACTPCSRNSPASIKPVGPPPATITSIMKIPIQQGCISARCSAQSGGARTPAPPRRVPATAPRVPPGGSTSPRPPYVDNNTRTSRLPFSPSTGFGRRFCGTTRVLPQGPGALYVEGGREWVTSLPLPYVVRCGRTSSSRSSDAPRTGRRWFRRTSHRPADAAAEREVLRPLPAWPARTSSRAPPVSWSSPPRRTPRSMGLVTPTTTP